VKLGGHGPDIRTGSARLARCWVVAAVALGVVMAARAGDAPVVSAAMAANISSGLPKYGDKPAPPAPRETPRNRIIRLPAYIVRQTPLIQKPQRPFLNRELYTGPGLVDLAMRRFMNVDTLNSKPFFANAMTFLFGSYAMLEYAEQERLDNIAQMADWARLEALAGDKKSAKELNAVKADYATNGGE
jgi:hypothetical protein